MTLDRMVCGSLKARSSSGLVVAWEIKIIRSGNISRGLFRFFLKVALDASLRSNSESDDEGTDRKQNERRRGRKEQHHQADQHGHATDNQEVHSVGKKYHPKE
ncbi:MAG: hypothetical protein IH989_03030 [Planctomycetes bacterium]|nr:hypothetical protein [Planctomycetota bacterium]